MKKTYVNAEWEIIFLANTDIITTSGELVYDPEGILDLENNNKWDW